jgi:hypothetical protein
MICMRCGHVTHPDRENVAERGKRPRVVRSRLMFRHESDDQRGRRDWHHPALEQVQDFAEHDFVLVFKPG